MSANGGVSAPWRITEYVTTQTWQFDDPQEIDMNLIEPAYSELGRLNHLESQVESLRSGVDLFTSSAQTFLNGVSESTAASIEGASMAIGNLADQALSPERLAGFQNTLRQMTPSSLPGLRLMASEVVTEGQEAFANLRMRAQGIIPAATRSVIEETSEAVKFLAPLGAKVKNAFQSVSEPLTQAAKDGVGMVQSIATRGAERGAKIVRAGRQLMRQQAEAAANLAQSVGGNKLFRQASNTLGSLFGGEAKMPRSSLITSLASSDLSALGQDTLQAGRDGLEQATRRTLEQGVSEAEKAVAAVSDLATLETIPDSARS